jgi:hypothetical protein
MMRISAKLLSREGRDPRGAFQLVFAAIATLTIFAFLTASGAQAHYSDNVSNSSIVAPVSVVVVTANDVETKNLNHCDGNSNQCDGACSADACCSACSTGVVAASEIIAASCPLSADTLPVQAVCPPGNIHPELQPPRLH